MFGDKRNFSMYINSLKNLDSMSNCFDVIYPSHNVCPLEKGAIKKCLDDAVDLYEGRITEYEKHESMPCNVYHGKYTGFFYLPE